MIGILLIENDLILRRDYAKSLEAGGFNVIPCPGGSEVESLVDNNNFEIILSDSDLGANNSMGYEIIGDLKKSGKLENKLIIGMSGSHDELDKWKDIAYWKMYKPNISDMGRAVSCVYARWIVKGNKIF